jgi:hypothetical protein
MDAGEDRAREGAGFFRRELGRPGRAAVAGAAGGGVLAGGFAVAALTLAGELGDGSIFLTASGLFAAGAVLGFIHGGILGYLGREEDRSVAGAIQDLGRGILYAVPALAVAWIVAVWIALTTMGVATGETVVLVLVGASWLAGAAVLGVATQRAAGSLRTAFGRWSDRREGTLLVAAVLVALLGLLLVDRPWIWGLELQLTTTEGVLLALGTTLWLAGPLVTAALRMGRSLPGTRPDTGFTGGPLEASVAALAAGAVLAGLAALYHATFTGVPVPAPPGGDGVSLPFALGQAVVNEVLLRFGLMTAVAWLLLDGRALPRRAAAWAAGGGIVVFQLVLYLPGMLEVGFPDVLSAAGYGAVHVALPAAVFAALYWRRGLAAALLGDASLLVLIPLLT